MLFSHENCYLLLTKFYYSTFIMTILIIYTFVLSLSNNIILIKSLFPVVFGISCFLNCVTILINIAIQSCIFVLLWVFLILFQGSTVD